MSKESEAGSRGMSQKEFLRRLDATLQQRAIARIERMYQSAMNLRDSSPTPEDWDRIESTYLRAYRSAYKTCDVAAFSRATKKYRKAVRP